jgi:hypothetical protein
LASYWHLDDTGRLRTDNASMEMPAYLYDMTPGDESVGSSLTWAVRVGSSQVASFTLVATLPSTGGEPATAITVEGALTAICVPFGPYGHDYLEPGG